MSNMTTPLELVFLRSFEFAFFIPKIFYERRVGAGRAGFAASYTREREVKNIDSAEPGEIGSS